MIFVDTNVLIDVIKNDPAWADWSQEQLDSATAVGAVAINDVVYAELSMGYPRIVDLDRMILETGVVLVPMPRLALFSAGKAFQRYRVGGGAKTGVLPDFFIGAQAEAMDVPLITRDPRRYRIYFPDLELITPRIN